jgi:hypothetical protein
MVYGNWYLYCAYWVKVAGDSDKDRITAQLVSNCSLATFLRSYQILIYLIDTLLYGFNGLGGQNSIWANDTIPGPPLNIEPFLLDVNSIYLFGWNLTEVGKKPGWVYENKTYSLEDIKLKGDCNPVGDVSSLLNDVSEVVSLTVDLSPARPSNGDTPLFNCFFYQTS